MFEAIELIKSNKYLFAGVILVVSLVTAVLVEFIITRVLMRLTRKTVTQLDDEIVAAMHRPLFLTVVLIGMSFALGRVTTSEKAVDIGNNILVTLGILLWTRAGMRIGNSVLAVLSKRMDEFKFIQPRTVPLFDIVIKTIVVGSAAYGFFIAWNVDVTAWLASAGIVGIAVGFAAKDTLSNLFSGIFILADAPYKLGDFIILDTGERGQVTDIGIRSTRLLTRDDIQIIVPNAVIGNAKIVNETGGPYDKERVRVNVGVAYGSDIDKVREVLLDIAEKSKYLATDPEPRVRFREFGDSSLNFQLMGWVDEPMLRGQALDELNTAVYKRFAKEDIRIPFPQRDVHLKKEF
ncbi:MAG: mechanosensitive ion channel family protein [Proteobacteria bacterium]|nr:mechanosensitive ion channel family protein [Pseudomonadota bacterium]